MDQPAAFIDRLKSEYEHFRVQFGTSLLSMMEIGSYSCGEYVSYYDHDLRFITRSQDPLLVFNEAIGIFPTQKYKVDLSRDSITHSIFLP